MPGETPLVARAPLLPLPPLEAPATTALPQPPRGRVSAAWRPWLPVGLGLAVLWLPAWFDLARGIWSTPEQGHGPVLLAVCVWLAWQRRAALIAGVPHPWPLAGWSLLLAGLLLFVLGRSQGLDSVLVCAHLPVLAGCLLLMRGPAPLRALWFALLFLLFVVPLPGVVSEALTAPLKREVSAVVEEVLYRAGYPIARTGVVLTIGQYQLLVADACSGLNSLFSLGALGLLYLYLTAATARRRPLHVGLLLLAIVPIALAANAVRVAALVLITWYFGDAAGQGLAHAGAGFLLFLVALLLLLAVDQMVGGVLTRWPAGGARRSGATRPAPATPGVGS